MYYLFSKLILIIKIIKNIIINNFSKYPNYVIEFEKILEKKFSSNFVLSFSNGTQAFEAALLSLGLEKGSKILLSKLSFSSTCVAVLKNGYIPIYLDFNINLETKINEEDADGASAIIITYIYGYTNDVKNIEYLKKNFPKIKIIADCSHAHGAKYEEKDIVNYADISFMSLQGAKAISAGEGGVIFTNSIDYFHRMIKLCHPSRKVSAEKTLSFSVPGFSKLTKSRIHPIGALIAAHDLKFIEKKNKLLKEKLNLIYENLKNTKKIYLPKININNTGGFHYGFPFFISKNKEKIENYSKIKFNKYNYLKYENYLELKDPNLFKDFQLSYKELSLSKSQPQTLDDLRDDLFLFDLDWIKNTNKDILRKEINSFKEFIE